VYTNIVAVKKLVVDCRVKAVYLLFFLSYDVLYFLKRRETTNKQIALVLYSRCFFMNTKFGLFDFSAILVDVFCIISLAGAPTPKGVLMETITFQSNIKYSFSLLFFHCFK